MLSSDEEESDEDHTLTPDEDVNFAASDPGDDPTNDNVIRDSPEARR